MNLSSPSDPLHGLRQHNTDPITSYIRYHSSFRHVRGFLTAKGLLKARGKAKGWDRGRRLLGLGQLFPSPSFPANSSPWFINHSKTISCAVSSTSASSTSIISFRRFFDAASRVSKHSFSDCREPIKRYSISSLSRAIHLCSRIMQRKPTVHWS